MANRTIYFDKCAAVSAVNQATHYTPGTTHLFELELQKALLIKTTASIDDIRFREFKSFAFYLHATAWDTSGTMGRERISIFRQAFDENTVTFSSVPGISKNFYVNFYKENVPGYGTSGDYILSGLYNLISCGAKVDGDNVELSTPNSNNKPYVIIEFGDENIGLEVDPTYPTETATISKSLDTIFSWSVHSELYASDLVGNEEIALSTAKFRWKYSGASSYNEVDVGANLSHTIPAGTFSTGTLQWQVEVTANSSVVTTTPWITVEVKEPVPSTVLVSPKNAVLDAAAAIRFEWSHVISNGTPQTKYDFQTSPDNSTWATIRTEATSVTASVFDPNAFEGGDLYWRVRTYNSDEIAGDWSESAHCIVIAAPDAPSIAITKNEPKFAIRWQQTGQQAFELMLDGAVILKKFGLDTSYQHNDYLADGSHIIQVRIQNKYGLWSNWGTAQILINNVPGLPINLFATVGESVELHWDNSSTYAEYWIYRNDVKIGKSSTDAYNDPFAVGLATYYVRGIPQDGETYTLSNAIEVNSSVKQMMIAAVDDLQWLDISKSMSSLRGTSANASYSITFKNYIGSELPSAEIGEHVSKTFKFDVAWLTRDQNNIQAFERLIGKLVCIKTPYGRRIIGILNPVDRQENRFTTTFSASVTLVDWKEWKA